MTMICFWASTCWSCDPSEKSWNQLEYIRIQCEISQDPASIQFSFKLANETQSSMEQHGYIYISTQAYMVEWLWLLVLRRTPMMLEGPLTRLEFPRSWPDFDSSLERRHTCSALMSADDGRWCCSYSGYDCNNPPVPFVYGSFLRNIWQPGQDKTSLSCEPHMFFFHGLEHGPGGSHVTTMLCP